MSLYQLDKNYFQFFEWWRVIYSRLDHSLSKCDNLHFFQWKYHNQLLLRKISWRLFLYLFTLKLKNYLLAFLFQANIKIYYNGVSQTNIIICTTHRKIFWVWLQSLCFLWLLLFRVKPIHANNSDEFLLLSQNKSKFWE